MDRHALELITQDAEAFDERGDAIAEAFYACLFDLDPDVRAMFPPDLAAQRRKLIDELRALVDLAASSAHEGHGDFAGRAGHLGETHRTYGVTVDHYRLVEIALLHGLEAGVPGWDDTHRAAWSRLYRLVAASMMSRPPRPA